MPSPGGRFPVSCRDVTLVPGISQPYFDPIIECPLPWDWTGSSRLAARASNIHPPYGSSRNLGVFMIHPLDLVLL